MDDIAKNAPGRPRYRALFEIRRLLKDEKEFPDGLMPSEQILARRLGISKPTVHRALGLLSAEGLLRCEGRQWMKSQASAPGKAIRKTTILYADRWHDLAHPYCAGFLNGIMLGAERHGSRIQVHLLRGGGSLQDANPELWNEISGEEADGLILSWITPEMHAQIRRANKNIAIVSTSTRISGYRIASVLFDRRSAGFQSVECLRRKDARKVLVIDYGRKNEFMAGAEEAAAVPRRISLSHRSVSLDADMGKEARKIAAEKPEGLVFRDDVVARKLLPECEKLISDFGRRTAVVSIVNAGDDSLPAFVSRIVFDPRRLGKAAVSAISAIVEGRPGSESVAMIRPHLEEAP